MTISAMEQGEALALYFAARHPETPWYAKLFVACVVAYAFSPIDLIPDFIPVLGYVDDLIRGLYLLATSDEPVCVCKLVEPLGLSQPTVSHHLTKLLDAGLIAREQRGKWAYFSLDASALRTLAAVADLKGACC